MDFFSAVAILVTYFLRPQDWLPGMAGANFMQPVALFAIATLLLRRKGVEVRDFLLTPHDALMYAYGCYIVFTAPDFTTALKEFLPLLVFYVVTVQALDSMQRISRYMVAWLVLLVVLAALGVGIQLGVDITGGEEITEAFGGRLALGTWIHNNPNALAHTLILAIPVIYFLMIWRRPFLLRLLALPLLVLVAYAIYRTESRGAFVSGLVVVTVGVILGRGRFVQALVVAFVAVSATGLLAVLPRMDRVENLRADEGVQGRMMAWEIARTAARQNLYGEGWKQFQAYIEYEGGYYKKATHSCYVRVGAELGYPGLFLYLAILWCGFRTLAGFRPEDDDGERVRRTLFVLLTGYVVSGWMIDRSYHIEYFLLAASIGAVHRQRVQIAKIEEKEAEAEEEAQDDRASVRVGFTAAMESRVIIAEPAETWRGVWNRFSYADIIIGVLLVKATLDFWDYILRTF